MITITEAEYKELQDAQDWVAALEAAGVDNWEGYDDAREIYRERSNDE